MNEILVSQKIQKFSSWVPENTHQILNLRYGEVFKKYKDAQREKLKNEEQYLLLYLRAISSLASKPIFRKIWRLTKNHKTMINSFVYYFDSSENNIPTQPKADMIKVIELLKETLDKCHTHAESNPPAKNYFYSLIHSIFEQKGINLSPHDLSGINLFKAISCELDRHPVNVYNYQSKHQKDPNDQKRHSYIIWFSIWVHFEATGSYEMTSKILTLIRPDLFPVPPPPNSISKTLKRAEATTKIRTKK